VALEDDLLSSVKVDARTIPAVIRLVTALV